MRRRSPKEDTSFVRRGPVRVRVLRELGKSDQSPIALARILKLHPSSVSRTLGELRKRRLVLGPPPEERSRGGLYRITELGRRIFAQLPIRGGTEGGESRSVGPDDCRVCTHPLLHHTVITYQAQPSLYCKLCMLDPEAYSDCYSRART